MNGLGEVVNFCDVGVELEAGTTKPPGEESGSDLGVWVEPPVGI
jgi:hypothetical protein